MAEKLYDMVVVTGQYKNANGETRNQFETIGAVFQGTKGKFFTLKSTFNPAGLNRDPNRDSIIGNLYAPRNSSGSAQESSSVDAESSDTDSDIPF